MNFVQTVSITPQVDANYSGHVTTCAMVFNSYPSTAEKSAISSVMELSYNYMSMLPVSMGECCIATVTIAILHSPD